MKHSDARGIYYTLMEGREGSPIDLFDAHVVACIYALASEDALFADRPITHFIGLSVEELASLLTDCFPRVIEHAQIGECETGPVQDDETCLRELLTRYSTNGGSPFERRMAALIARRAMQPNHLWQDLGVRNRGELSQLIRRHFAPLAERNVRDMKWKKFLYRMICRDDGYRLCVAPVCSECDDFEICFGDESGESLLARNRRNAPDRFIPLSV